MSLHKINDKASDGTKMKQVWAAKDARLKELESKVTQLEEKVTRLEENELQQESLIKKLQKEREISSSIGENSVGIRWEASYFPGLIENLVHMIRHSITECTGSTSTTRASETIPSTFIATWRQVNTFLLNKLCICCLFTIVIMN